MTSCFVYRLYTLISPPQKSLPEEDPPTHEEELDEDDMSRAVSYTHLTLPTILRV